MIELTSADVSVISKLAGIRDLDYLPTAQLNDDGQTEIVRWIESVGKQDDQLTPYAWFALAEEAAASHEVDAPIAVEMLPLYTLSGESEILELSREAHFDWSIEAVPVEFIQNTDELLDMGVPVRMLLMAEVAGDAFTRYVCEWCPDVDGQETPLLAAAINAFFVLLCEEAGIAPDDAFVLFEDDEMSDAEVDVALFEDAFHDAFEEGRKAILSLDENLDDTLAADPDELFQCFDRR